MCQHWVPSSLLEDPPTLTDLLLAASSDVQECPGVTQPSEADFSLGTPPCCEGNIVTMFMKFKSPVQRFGTLMRMLYCKMGKGAAQNRSYRRRHKHALSWLLSAIAIDIHFFRMHNAPSPALAGKRYLKTSSQKMGGRKISPPGLALPLSHSAV